MGVYGGVMCVMVILNIVCVRFFMCLYLLVILHLFRCILFIVYICVIWGGGVVVLYGVSEKWYVIYFLHFEQFVVVWFVLCCCV